MMQWMQSTDPKATRQTQRPSSESSNLENLKKSFMNLEHQFIYDERIAIGMEYQPPGAPVPAWLKAVATEAADQHVDRLKSIEEPELFGK